MGQIYLQTEKDKYKDVPCTFAGCDNLCRVNTFYAPAKAKCPLHGGTSIKSVGTAASPARSAESSSDDDFDAMEARIVSHEEAPKLPNYRLGELMCPICTIPLQMLSISESHKFLGFSCPDCGMTIDIGLDWAHMHVRRVPDALVPLVKEFNRLATLKMVSS